MGAGLPANGSVRGQGPLLQDLFAGKPAPKKKLHLWLLARLLSCCPYGFLYFSCTFLFRNILEPRRNLLRQDI